MSCFELLELNITALSAKIKNKQVSPVETTHQLLTRIEKLNEKDSLYIKEERAVFRTPKKQVWYYMI
ncbi:hypothetical protein GCM10011571_12680 [Marinithermofilum abyssi]|uniref:Uncharacterized protein n=1 Tax=Marinithermofilum abyssi TaxID=1571185 RepID=A0A8J2VI23_9BACL|nr:hypothetical protein [Marinithermofilum abyssi]GGE12728.1 hypothetical protein GCM10011571_12680 [Marinithermofilum abyssi]